MVPGPVSEHNHLHHFERHDLSGEKPDLTMKLHKQLKHWLHENVAPRYMPQRDESVSPEDAAGPFPFRDLRQGDIR